MKISEISNKTDKQYFEDFKSSVGTTLRKYGAKALSAMGNKDAKQEALVLEVITQLYQSFAAYSKAAGNTSCLLYTSPSPRDGLLSRMPSSA